MENLMQVWPLDVVLTKLADAADHYLDRHSCDHHGYEEVMFARDAARQWVSHVNVQEPTLDEMREIVLALNDSKLYFERISVNQVREIARVLLARRNQDA